MHPGQAKTGPSYHSKVQKSYSCLGEKRMFGGNYANCKNTSMFVICLGRIVVTSLLLSRKYHGEQLLFRYSLLFAVHFLCWNFNVHVGHDTYKHRMMVDNGELTWIPIYDRHGILSNRIVRVTVSEIMILKTSAMLRIRLPLNQK